MAAQAHWCRRYARANAAGLRKIAKKHDKHAANDAGRRFVQVRSAAAWVLLAARLLRHDDLLSSSDADCSLSFTWMFVAESLHASSRELRTWL